MENGPCIVDFSHEVTSIYGLRIFHCHAAIFATVSGGRIWCSTNIHCKHTKRRCTKKPGLKPTARKYYVYIYIYISYAFLVLFFLVFPWNSIYFGRCWKKTLLPSKTFLLQMIENSEDERKPTNLLQVTVKPQLINWKQVDWHLVWIGCEPSNCNFRTIWLWLGH